MINRDKLYNDFLHDWGEEFENLKHILKYLHSYPELISKFKTVEFVKPDELEKIQKEWLTVVEGFENETDREFFKAYWVPMSIEGMGFFIDLSSKMYSLFECLFFPTEPASWNKLYLIKDMRKLLMSPDDSSIDIDEMLQHYEEEHDASIFYSFAQDDVDLHENEDDKLVLKNVMPTIIAILPWITAIEIREFESKKPNTSLKSINDIQSFLTLMQNTGTSNITYFYLRFPELENSYLEYENGNLTLRHPDKELLRKLAEYGN